MNTAFVSRPPESPAAVLGEERRGDGTTLGNVHNLLQSLSVGEEGVENFPLTVGPDDGRAMSAALRRIASTYDPTQS